MSGDTSSAAHRIDETSFERHSWKVLIGSILVIGIFGVGDMVHGAADLQSGEAVLMHSVTRTSWNELLAPSPNIANLIDLKFRTEGTSYVAIALLTLITCLGDFGAVNGGPGMLSGSFRCGWHSPFTLSSTLTRIRAMAHLSP